MEVTGELISRFSPPRSRGHRSSLVDGLYVEDDGPGIPPEGRKTVLARKYTTKAEGAGIGLAIGKEIAEARGWTVDVTESSEGGARCEITGVNVTR